MALSKTPQEVIEGSPVDPNKRPVPAEVTTLLTEMRSELTRLVRELCKPSRGKPNRGKPSRSKPSHGKPSQGKPSQGKPSRNKPSRGKPGPRPRRR